MSDSIVNALIGGGLIGLAVTMMLLFNGRVTGISGIISASLAAPSRDGMWRWLFVAGMVVGGFIMHRLQPEFFTNVTQRGSLVAGIAGLLVGYGTVMGSGCTSGHGVCGMSRLSIRSVIATVTFMLFGVLTAVVTHFILGAAV